MATQVTNYQCPACTGPLHYVGESGMLECDYCGSKYTAAEAKSADSGWGDEVEDMRAYSCPSCGAELICNATTAATSWLDRPEMMSDSPCVRGNCSTPEMGEISLTSNPRSKARQFSERGRFIFFATI